MILTRSPFYYNVVFPNSYVTYVDFTLVIGNGSTSSINELYSYEFTKRKPSDDSTNTWIDISPYIRDFYNPKPLSVSAYTSPVVVESTEVLLATVTSQPVDSLGSTIDPSSKKYICADGYGYYMELSLIHI